MSTRSLRLPAGGILALMLIALTVSPAAAATVTGEGYYSRFSFGAGDGGLVVTDRVDPGSGRVRALVSGLLASQEYFIAGRSIGCTGNPSQSNRVFRLTATTDAEGDLWVDRSVVLKDVMVSSIWIGRTDAGASGSCRTSINFETRNVATGDVNGDGAAGVVDGTSNTLMGLVEMRSSGQARLSVVIDPHDQTGGTYVVTFANRACGKTPTKAFTLKLENVLVSSFMSKTVDMTQDQLDGLRSVRFRNTADGTDFGCAPLSVLIALLLP